jgi:hypothetical protein
MMPVPGRLGTIVTAMALSRKQQVRFGGRLTALGREVGTLLLAFAPLDYFQKEYLDVEGLLWFVLAGIMLFAYSLIWELRGVR